MYLITEVQVDGEQVTVYAITEPADVEGLWPNWEDFLGTTELEVLGLDVETNATEEEDNPGQWRDGFEVRTVQLGTRNQAWVLPSVYCEDMIRQVLEDGNRRFVTHSVYDTKSIWTFFGIPLGDRVYDTLVMARVLTPDDKESHDLKHLSTSLIDGGLVHAEEVMYAKFRELYPDDTRRAIAKKKLAAYGFTNIPLDDPDYLLYAGLDTVYCRRLFDMFLDEFEAFPQLFDMEMWLNGQATDATIRGIILDKEYTSSLKDEAERITNEADAKIREITGYGASQNKRLGEWFIERGCVFDKVTDTGAPSFSNSKGHLDHQIARESNEEALDVLKLMKTVAENKNTLTNTKNLLGFVDRDGRVHPDIRTLQAKTSRMSITKPPMQTIKKNRDKEDSPMRKCFLADPGHVLIGSDFEQVELRVAAALSGEDKLIDAILTGEDLHSSTAKLMFGPNYTPAHRQICKTINFGVLYGAGVATVVTQTQISEDQAREAIKLWRKSYPKLSAALRAWGDLDTVRTPSGRLIPADPGRGYANGNYMVQSTARELLVHALYRFVEVKGWHGRLFLPVHDEIIVQAPPELVEPMRADLEWAMNFDFMGVPIEAEAEIIGERWGVAA